MNSYRENGDSSARTVEQRASVMRHETEENSVGLVYEGSSGITLLRNLHFLQASLL